MRANRQPAASCKPSAVLAQPAAVRWRILSQPCSGCAPVPFWEHEAPPAPFLFVIALVLESLGSASEENASFLTPDSLSLLAPALYTGSDAPLALHRALLGLRAHPLPAWLLSLLIHNGFCS